MNTQSFCYPVLEEARRTLITITKNSGIEETLSHMDNCKVHNSTKIMKGFEEFQVTGLSHLLCSPGASLYRFWLFDRSKDVMRSQKFYHSHHVRALILDLWYNLDPSTLIPVYHKWIERLEHVIVMNEECHSDLSAEIRFY
jgi:hypothetical protein